MPFMKLHRRRAPLLVALALVGSATLAQGNPSPSRAAATPRPAEDIASEDKALTVADLVALVQRHNPQLRATVLGREAATAAVSSARAYPNPSLEAGAGHTRARLPGASAGAASAWSMSQLLENPTLRSARIDGARHGLEGSRQQVAATVNALGAQTRLRAYELLLRREETAAAADALTLLEQIRERVSTRVQSGEAPRYESIKADAEVVIARQRHEAARLGEEEAVLALHRLAAGQLPARWRLAASLVDAPVLPPVEQLEREAQERNPEVTVLRAEVARREAQLREARASRFPGVELRYGRQSDTEVRQDMLGVAVRLPLLDTRRGPIDEAAAELARAQTLLDGRRTDLSLQIRTAAAALEVARLRVDALSNGALPDAEAALRVAQAAYRFGERGILDVLDAQRLLRAVRADLIDARFRLQSAAVELEFLAGRFTPAEARLTATP